MKISNTIKKITLAIIVFLGFGAITIIQPNSVQAQPVVGCGQFIDVPGGRYCDVGGNRVDWGNFSVCPGEPDRCCTDANLCNQPTPQPTLKPFEPLTDQTLNALNPLMIGGGDDIDSTTPSVYADELSSPGGIVSRVLDFAIPIAGLILFAMLVWGGFEMLVGAPSGKSIDAGKQRVTAAIAGFVLLFSSYWLMQIIEVVFGVVIL